MILGGKRLHNEWKGFSLFSNETHEEAASARMKVQVEGEILLLRTNGLQVTNTAY